MFDRIFLNGGSGGGGWIGVLASGQIEGIGTLALDNDKNIYICSLTTNPSTPYGISTIKLNNLGVIQFQKKLRTSFNSFGRAVTIDANNAACYVVGDSSLIGGNPSPVLAKYNLSGTLQWQRGLNQGAQKGVVNVTTDSSGNVYYCGGGIWGGNQSYTCAFYIKYNSSGTYQTTKSRKVYTDEQVRNDYGLGIKVDNSGNIYTVGYTQDYRPPNYFPSRYPNTWTFGVTVKYDSANNVLWYKRLTAGDESYANDVALSNTGDVYVCGQAQYYFTTSQCLLVKYNASGVIQWQRQLDNSASQAAWSKIAIDGDGNIYCAGYSNINGTYGFLLAKYNSSGTLLWQNLLRADTFNIYGGPLAVDNAGSLYVGGDVGTANGDMLIAKLPTDGSGTGTYSVNGLQIFYTTVSLTNSTPNYTQNDASDAGGDLYQVDPTTTTLTEENTTLTSVVTQI